MAEVRTEGLEGMTDKPRDDNPDRRGSEQKKPRPVPGYQASPEEQTRFARTYGSDLVIMPVAPRQRPSKTTKKPDEPEVLPIIKRDEEA